MKTNSYNLTDYAHKHTEESLIFLYSVI